MQTSRPRNDDAPPSRNSSSDNALSMEHLAHQLNSLLDGSMRCVRMAGKALGGSTLNEDLSVSEALSRLQTAEQAMNDMSAVLIRAMAGGTRGSEVLHSGRSIGQEVDQVMRATSPLAAQHRVDLRLDLSPAAADMPAGPLGPILLNGLHNAIEACASDDRLIRRIEISLAINGPGTELMLIISDTGPGLRERPQPGRSTKPEGHGLGLEVCRQLLHELGGRMELTNVPFGGGAVLQAFIPLRSLAVS